MLQRLHMVGLFVVIFMSSACDIEVETSSQNAGAQEIQGIIQQRCAGCHNSAAGEGDAFTVPRTNDDLVFSGYVIPGKVKESPLTKWLDTHGQDEKTPLKQRISQKRKDWLSEAEKSKIIKWIRDGAGGYFQSDLGRFSPIQLLAAIESDFEKLSNEKKSSVRYLYFTHYLNYPIKTDVIKAVQQAVSTAVNSISTSEKLALPFYFGPEKLIVRLDMDDYNWKKKHWEQLTRDYPYAPYFNGHDKTSSLGKINSKTEARLSVIRGDWFLHHAVAEASYYRFLEIPQTFDEFEKYIDLDFAKQYEGQNYIRAGFAKSGVATHNRTIERHDRKNGYVWRSFEFATSTGTNNILEFPFGPIEARTAKEDPASTDAKDPNAPVEPIEPVDPDAVALAAAEKDHSFTPQGSEFIFNLPNGMLGYYILQGDQALQSAPAAGGLPAVRVGLSCMRCHEGLIFRKDEVRIRFTKALPESLKQKLLSIYVLPDKLNEKINGDSVNFRKALREIEVGIDVQQPVVTVSDDYESQRLSAAQIFAELGLEPIDFKKQNAIFYGTSPSKVQSNFDRATVSSKFQGILDQVKARLIGIDVEPIVNPNSLPKDERK